MGKKPSHILITGASSGIGQALALHYAAPGVRLSLAGRNEERLEAVAYQCRVKGANVTGKVLTVTDRNTMKEWIEAIDQDLPIDLVFANAGISGGTGGVFSGEGYDQVRMIFDVNLNGVLNTIEPLLPRMIARGDGDIALMSSLAGFKGWPGAPAYCGSKAAVKVYGEGLRGSLSKTGVRVHVVCPGFVESRMTDANNFFMPLIIPADKAAKIIARGINHNVGRIAFPWLAYVMVWFISMLPVRLSGFILKRMPAKGNEL